MPRPRTLKALLFDAVVFVGMFALVGHLSMNFWERFMIQSELTSMKTSLHSLKETITKIGCAYDNLHRELVGLAVIAENKTETHRKRLQTPTRKKRHPIDRSHHDIRIQAIAQAKNGTTIAVPSRHDKIMQNYVLKNKSTQIFTHFKKSVCPVKNVTTITRYPRKSTGVGEDVTYPYKCPNGSNCKYRSCTNVQRCCNEYNCQNSPDNWRF